MKICVNKNDVRAYPYCLYPDELWAFLGAVILLFFLVPTLVFVGAPLVIGELLFFLMRSIGIYNFTGLKPFVSSMAKRLLVDPRNEPYLFPIFFIAIYMPLLLYWAINRYNLNGFEWITFITYHFLRTGPRYRFFTWNHVLVHKEGHDHVGFFKKNYKFLNNICNWWNGLFYGVIPNSYRISHNKIHHSFNNMLEDIHTNYDLDRTQPYSFLLYVPRFAGYWTSISPIWYFSCGVKKPEWKFLIGLVSGLLYYIGWCALVCYFSDFRFVFLFLVLPLPEAVVFLGGVSYLWHAFLDPVNYDNDYVSSITILNGRENMWNEDYHVAHHSTLPLHWTEYEEHFKKNISAFRDNKATIFTDTEQGELFFLVISKNWKKLAEKFVDLSNTMTLQDKIELILQRLSHTVKDSSKVGSK